MGVVWGFMGFRGIPCFRGFYGCSVGNRWFQGLSLWFQRGYVAEIFRSVQLGFKGVPGGFRRFRESPRGLQGVLETFQRV